MAQRWQPDFEQLVDEHQSMVFSLAWRMTGDRGLAEEVAQDVFLELDRHMERLESPEHALNWLRRVAVSRSTDSLRRRRVRGVDLWVEIDEKHGSPAEERQSPLETRLEQLLSTLPEAHSRRCQSPLLRQRRWRLEHRPRPRQRSRRPRC